MSRSKPASCQQRAVRNKNSLSMKSLGIQIYEEMATSDARIRFASTDIHCHPFLAGSASRHECTCRWFSCIITSATSPDPPLVGSIWQAFGKPCLEAGLPPPSASSYPVSCDRRKKTQAKVKVEKQVQTPGIIPLYYARVAQTRSGVFSPCRELFSVIVQVVKLYEGFGCSLNEVPARAAETLVVS